MMRARNAWIGTALATAALATFFACSSEDDILGGGGSAASGATHAGGGSAAGGSGSGLDAGLGASGGGTVVTDGGLDGDVCAASTVTAKAIPAALYILLDRSGSMRCNPPPLQDSAQCELNPIPVNPAEPTKWSITHNALNDAFSQLESAAPPPSVGLAYFNDDNYCGFPTEPDVLIVELSGDAATDPQLAALQTSLAGVNPQGYTPIVGTVMGAYQYLHLNADSYPGNRFVVLLTDGFETCDPDSIPLLVQKALEASWVGIRTFVLGAPGSEGARAMLSQIAFNGGTASYPSCDHSGVDPAVGDCHMDMTDPNTDFAQALAENLARISVEALSCVFDIPEPEPGDPPVDLSKVNVTYSSGGGEPELIFQDNTRPCDDPANEGWQYTAGNSKIELCGAACEMVKNDPEAEVIIELGCQTQVVPR